MKKNTMYNNLHNYIVISYNIIVILCYVYIYMYSQVSEIIWIVYVELMADQSPDI